MSKRLSFAASKNSSAPSGAPMKNLSAIAAYDQRRVAGQLPADAVDEARVDAAVLRDGERRTFTPDLTDGFGHEEHPAHPGMHRGESAAVGVDRERAPDAEMCANERP